jgi:hypothetical protein
MADFQNFFFGLSLAYIAHIWKVRTGLPLSNTSVLVLSREAIVADISKSAEVEDVLPDDFSACMALRIELLGGAPGCM